MTQANELRIGNWVTLRLFEEPKTTAIEFSKTDFNNLERLDPIPLTEEWLHAFGFTNSEIGLFEKRVLTRGKINVHITRKKLLVELGTSGSYLFGNTNIKYVHQLQNLYFALTQTELEIKETTVQ